MRIVLSYIRNSGINSKWSCCNGILRLCSVMSTSLTVPIMRQGSRYGWECLFDPSLSRYASPNSGVIISRQINPNFWLDFHKTKVTWNDNRVRSRLLVLYKWLNSPDFWRDFQVIFKSLESLQWCALDFLNLFRKINQRVGGLS